MAPALGSGESSEVVISVTPDIFDGEEIILKAVLEVKGDMDRMMTLPMRKL